MQKLRRFLLNGLIMSGTSLLLRALGVGFNAFVSRKLGADGMGLFTLIMSVYGLSVTAAAAGVNLAATRMCAEAIGHNDECTLRASLRKCFIYALGCGLAAGGLLFFGAEYVALCWLRDIRCTRSLRLLAVSLPFISASNVLHGYFTAVRRVSKSAVTQIFEQIFKTLVTVTALLYIVPDGIEYACIALVGGGALAEIASFIMALVFYLIDRKGIKKAHLPPEKSKHLTRELLGITVPVAAAACLRSGLTTVEHILIPRGLQKNPLTAKTALAAYGVLCGMAMPVIMFPTALLYSFTALLIPEFAETEAASDIPRLKSMITRSLSLTMIFSQGCTVLMAVFSDELGLLLYQSTDVGRFIGIMAPLIPIMYLDHAVDSMLKGLGEQLYCMKVNILDAALCTLLVWFLCPRIGIYGYIITLYTAEVMNASLSLYRLYKVCRFNVSLTDQFIKPTFCAVGTAAILRLIQGVLSLDGWIGLTVGTVLAAAVYTTLLFGIGAISHRDSVFDGIRRIRRKA